METGTCSGCTETRLRLSPDMLAQIPAGSMPITLGSGTYRPSLTAFNMGKYQITQDQYFEIMGNNPSAFTTDADGGEVQGKRPVEVVTWYAAILFCNRLSIAEGLTPAYSVKIGGVEVDWDTVSAPTAPNTDWDAAVIVPGSDGYRLPTDAQWEYACRAGSIGEYSIGAGGTVVTDLNLGDYAWYEPNGNDKTHEVGKKTANAFGLYDMHGNVWEWCWDWYDDYPPSGTPTDTTGPDSGSYRVVRGGNSNAPAAYISSSFLYHCPPDANNITLGFRVARP